MLEKYRFHKPNPRNMVELKAVLEGIWADLPQAPIDKAILAFRKRLGACVNADGGNFEHQLFQLSIVTLIGPFQGHQNYSKGISARLTGQHVMQHTRCFCCSVAIFKLFTKIFITFERIDIFT
jgi:hypothetical protein